MRTVDQLINTVVAEPEGLIPLATNLATGHDPVLNPSKSNRHNLTPEESA
jgi:hypothetical protein